MSEEKEIKGTEKKETEGSKKVENPLLSQPMETKGYAGNTSQESASGNTTAPIPEPTFQRPPGHDTGSAPGPTPPPKSDGPSSSSAGGSQSGGSKQPPNEPVNPHYNKYSGGDKKYGAATLATMAVTAYEKLWSFPATWIIVSDKKIDKLHKEGKIDVNMKVPYMGEEVMAKDLIDEYNNSHRGILAVSPEFKKEVIPLLTEIFEERGIGMSKEQYLGYLILTDSAAKVWATGQAVMARQEMFSILTDATEHYKKLHSKKETKIQETVNSSQPDINTVFPTGKERAAETFTEAGEKAETIQKTEAPVIKMETPHANNSVIEEAQVISETSIPSNVIVTTGEGSKKEEPKGQTLILPDKDHKEREAAKKKEASKAKAKLTAATKKGKGKGGSNVVFP